MRRAPHTPSGMPHPPDPHSRVPRELHQGCPRINSLCSHEPHPSGPDASCLEMIQQRLTPYPLLQVHGQQKAPAILSFSYRPTLWLGSLLSSNRQKQIRDLIREEADMESPTGPGEQRERLMPFVPSSTLCQCFSKKKNVYLHFSQTVYDLKFRYRKNTNISLPPYSSYQYNMFFHPSKRILHFLFIYFHFI